MTTINLKGKFNASFEVLPTRPLAGGGTGTGGSGTGGFGTPDTTPPTVTITSPSPGETISGIVTVTGTAADNVGVDNVTISIDGGAFHVVTLSGTTWSFVLDTSLYPTGLATISATATDTSGNTATATETLSFGAGGVIEPTYFVGDFAPGDFSQWGTPPGTGALSDIGNASVVSSPAAPGFTHSMKCVNLAGTPSTDASVVEIGSNVDAQELIWEVIPADVWHRILMLFPSGANPSFPGQFHVSTGWNVVMEWHNRTDPASGYPGLAASNYLSAYVGVHNDGDGTASLVYRSAGGTLPAPVLREQNLANLTGQTLIYDHWYDILVRHIYRDDATGWAEWWVDGVQVAAYNAPTAYLCVDGLSGCRFQVGHYRGVAPLGYTDTIYVGGVRVGPTKASVYP